MKFEWESLDKNTRRLKVIGGWVLHSNAYYNGSNESTCSESMTFIPDPEWHWVITKY